jgi:hypothetical protein
MVKRIKTWLLLILLIILRIVSKKRILLEYKLIKESKMGLIYRAFLPPVQAVDVVTRLIKYKVNQVDTILEASTSDSYFDLPPVKEGDTCLLSIKDIDDAGNESEWSAEVAFTAKDTLVPGTPEGLSVKLSREVADVQVDPAPEPEVAPVVEDVDVAPVIVRGEDVVTPTEDVETSPEG